MWASIKNGDDGIVIFHLDEEAARAVVASLIFAARFHQNFAPLALIAERGLEQTWQQAQKGEAYADDLCRA